MQCASLKQEGTSKQKSTFAASLPSLCCKSKLSPTHTSALGPSLQKFILILLPDKVLPLCT